MIKINTEGTKTKVKKSEENQFLGNFWEAGKSKRRLTGPGTIICSLSDSSGWRWVQKQVFRTARVKVLVEQGHFPVQVEPKWVQTQIRLQQLRLPPALIYCESYQFNTTITIHHSPKLIDNELEVCRPFQIYIINRTIIIRTITAVVITILTTNRTTILAIYIINLLTSFRSRRVRVVEGAVWS